MGNVQSASYKTNSKQTNYLYDLLTMRAIPVLDFATKFHCCGTPCLCQIMGKVDPHNDKDRKISHKFAQMYLRQDGVFVLKLVAKNSTDLVVADIIAALWDNYKSKPMFGSRSSEDIDIDDVT